MIIIVVIIMDAVSVTRHIALETLRWGPITFSVGTGHVVSTSGRSAALHGTYTI